MWLSNECHSCAARHWQTLSYTSTQKVLALHFKCALFKRIFGTQKALVAGLVAAALNGGQAKFYERVCIDCFWA